MNDQRRMPTLATELSVFSCHQSELIAGVLSKHPNLASLLVRIAEQVSRVFRSETVKQLRLRPSSGPYPAEDVGLVVDIVVTADESDARASLGRFDEEWWFEASGRCPVEIVIDIRRE
ncbi:hypothetical protein [Nannocystis bainbridge]|uniref:Uncharacterized protein n=1 Tax=Nannocystis bainbridge TaxID=2995303 RepID=A0ABT5E627_9BACT|nr:hypothetical protein [Nannocystis bainbridge]MDC0720898.1 hypothetical protein [Nannocystis bainbridge]